MRGRNRARAGENCNAKAHLAYCRALNIPSETLLPNKKKKKDPRHMAHKSCT